MRSELSTADSKQSPPSPNAAGERSSGWSAPSFLALGLGAVAALGTVVWIRSRSREAPLDERTRDRLRPRLRVVQHQAPSAADIRIG